MFACSMGFSGTTNRMVWLPSLSRDRKWLRITKCTHSRVFGRRLEGNLVFKGFGVGSRAPLGQPMAAPLDGKRPITDLTFRLPLLRLGRSCWTIAVKQTIAKTITFFSCTVSTNGRSSLMDAVAMQPVSNPAHPFMLNPSVPVWRSRQTLCRMRSLARTIRALMSTPWRTAFAARR